LLLVWLVNIFVNFNEKKSMKQINFLFSMLIFKITCTWSLQGNLGNGTLFQLAKENQENFQWWLNYSKYSREYILVVRVRNGKRMPKMHFKRQRLETEWPKAILLNYLYFTFPHYKNKQMTFNLITGHCLLNTYMLYWQNSWSRARKGPEAWQGC
jgi:hypothetical protein